jgi:hypothetical protein
MTKAEKAETAWVMVDGEQQYYRVTDPMVFKAVAALETMGKPGPSWRWPAGSPGRCATA